MFLTSLNAHQIQQVFLLYFIQDKIIYEHKNDNNNNVKHLAKLLKQLLNLYPVLEWVFFCLFLLLLFFC